MYVKKKNCIILDLHPNEALPYDQPKLVNKFYCTS